MIGNNVFWSVGDAILPDLAENVVGDPVFVDAASGDFRLAPDSPYAGLGASAERFETGVDV